VRELVVALAFAFAVSPAQEVPPPAPAEKPVEAPVVPPVAPPVAEPDLASEVLALARSAGSAAEVGERFNRAFRPRWDKVKSELPAATKTALRLWFTEEIAAGNELEQELFVALFRVAVDSAAAATSGAPDSALAISAAHVATRELVAALFDHPDHATVSAKIGLLAQLEQQSWGIVSDEVRALLPSYVGYAFQTQQIAVLEELLREGRFRCRDALALSAREAVLRDKESAFSNAVIDQFGALLGVTNGAPSAAERELSAQLLALLEDGAVAPEGLPAAFNRLIRPRRDALAPFLSPAASAALRDYFTRRIVAGDAAEQARFLQLFELARDAGASVVDLVGVLADSPDFATAPLKIELLGAIDRGTFGDQADVIDAATAPYVRYAIERQKPELLDLLVDEKRFPTSGRIARRIHDAVVAAEATSPNFADHVKERLGARIDLKSRRQLEAENLAAAAMAQQEEARAAELARQEAAHAAEAAKQAELAKQRQEADAAKSREMKERELARLAQVEKALAEVPAALAARDSARLDRRLAELAAATPAELEGAREKLLRDSCDAVAKAFAEVATVAALDDEVGCVERLAPLAPFDRQLMVAATRPLLDRLRSLPDEEIVAAYGSIPALLTRVQNLAGTQGLFRLLEADFMAKRARVAAHQLAEAVHRYVAERGQFPASLDDLLPSGGSPGFVADRAALWDPWKRRFTLAVEITAFTVRSAGPNGVAGDADDAIARGFK